MKQEEKRVILRIVIAAVLVAAAMIVPPCRKGTGCMQRNAAMTRTAGKLSLSVRNTIRGEKVRQQGLFFVFGTKLAICARHSVAWKY